MQRSTGLISMVGSFQLNDESTEEEFVEAVHSMKFTVMQRHIKTKGIGAEVLLFVGQMGVAVLDPVSDSMRSVVAVAYSFPWLNLFSSRRPQVTMVNIEGYMYQDILMWKATNDALTLVPITLGQDDNGHGHRRVRFQTQDGEAKKIRDLMLKFAEMYDLSAWLPLMALPLALTLFLISML